MKKIVLSIALVVGCTLATFGQIKPKLEDWIFYDYSYSQLLNTPAGITPRFLPNSHAVSFFRDIPFGHGNFGMALGLGYATTSYYNNLQITTDVSTGDEVFAVMNSDSVKSNRMRTDHIDALLELRFRTKPNDKGRFFRFYVGARYGVRVDSYARLITDKINVQYNNLGALDRFRYGVHARIGYGSVNLFAYYGLSDVFRKGQIGADGVQGITSLSTGLSITL